ncbi:conserved repeat domain protein [Methanohalobium evestigatum Z-7303]|uniref:Conserved repeat domain protein n=2 Tax=Methanohalobium evestigatum TaxID=2322 RepID=D7E5Z0_METEZ|nr:conserved repeat domain protein [Methanohalobium evestigatum Z-7303]
MIKASRIIILLMLVFLIFQLVPAVSAYSFQDELIWEYGGEYKLSKDERAKVGPYTIKIHEINPGTNPPSANVLIYQNNVYKEKLFFDTKANSENTYEDDLKIKIHDINRNNVSVELYRHVYKKAWVKDTERKGFHKGDELKNGNYTVQVKEFKKKEVVLEVSNPYKKNIFTDNYKEAESRKYYNEFMVRVASLYPEKGIVYLETYRPGNPDFSIDILNNKDSYNPNKTIEYKVLVENIGNIPVQEVKLESSSNNGKIAQPVMVRNVIDQNKSKIFPVMIDPPNNPIGENMATSFVVSGRDYRGNTYTDSKTVSTHINSYMKIEKEISKEDVTLYRENKNDTVQVSLIIHNMGKSKKLLDVTDEIPDSFTLIGNDSLEKSVVVNSDSTKKVTYQIKPTKPGRYTLKPAVLEWVDEGNKYTTESSEKEIDVHSSWVQVDKSLSSDSINISNNVEVTINIENTGNRIANISFTDSIPEGLNLVSGDLQWSGKVGPKADKEITYTITTNESGRYVLPELEVDINNNQTKAISNSAILYVDKGVVTEQKHEEPIITRIDATKFMVTAFMAILALLSLAPISAYINIKRKE